MLGGKAAHTSFTDLTDADRVMCQSLLPDTIARTAPCAPPPLTAAAAKVAAR